MSAFPGPKTAAVLERGVPLFLNGRRYEDEKQAAARRGFRAGAQIVVDRAEGDFVWDLDGRRFIDFQNGWATNPLGNAHPEIVEAVHTAQRRYGFHYDHPLRYELAEKLATIMPDQALPRFSYEVSGTEAAEAAIYMAMCYKRRRHVITFSSSYHGNSIACKVASGGDPQYKPFLEGWQGGIICAPFPYSDHLPVGLNQETYSDYCLWYIENHIVGSLASADNIAGIMIEPGLAEGGNWIPNKAFLQGIRDICDRNDWLMIADEVLAGLGRTGKMWAVEHYDVVPDILVVGKNLSGGIEPCAGVAARDDVLGDNPLYSAGSTFAGTPAGCAAGLATLAIYHRDNIIDHAAALSAIASDIMASWESSYGIVRQVRANGLLIGVSFQAPEGQGEHEHWWYSRAVRSRMLECGVWAISDREDTIRLYPALNMNADTLREGLHIMEDAIAHVEQHGQALGDSPAWPTGVAGF
ncbi:MAG: aspartate aminotransferase family protein [Pseudomonadota bacterium]